MCRVGLGKDGRTRRRSEKHKRRSVVVNVWEDGGLEKDVGVVICLRVVWRPELRSEREKVGFEYLQQ